MGKLIRLTESDLEIIVKKVLDEQSVVGAPNYGTTQKKSSETTNNTKILPCVPEAFKLPTNTLVKKNYNKLLLKAALGIIGRESDFGESNRFKFTSPLKTLWAAFGGQTSVGYAQIKPETAEKYGIGLVDLNMALGSLDAAYKILSDNYNKALKIGYTTEAPQNLKEGTGNAALDLAIAGYNMGASKIVKYCKTSDPNIKKPCSLAGKTLQEQDGSIELAMNRRNQEQLNPKPNNKKSIKVTNEEVKNYIPNFKTKRWDGVSISSHGYIKEVASRVKSYNCF
jgi:hypothetical protein